MFVNRGMDKEYVVYIYICTHTHIHIYTVEYYSAIKKNEIVLFATTWMDLEIITQNEVSLAEKAII